jgi:hypothetical protein
MAENSILTPCWQLAITPWVVRHELLNVLMVVCETVLVINISLSRKIHKEDKHHGD